MKIGIFDPYLDTLSGGEKYMLSMAACLADHDDVIVFWDDKSIAEAASKKLKIDISKVSIKPNIFAKDFSAARRLLESNKYDRLVFLSDGSIPMTLAKKTILHFQFPVEWVKAGDLKTKLKLLKIDKIICNSFFTKNFIDKKFGVESQVLYPPCISLNDLKNFEDKQLLNPKKNIILTVGRYSHLSGGGSFKKLEIMIAAFKKMVDEGLKNWEFFIAVSYKKEEEKYIEEIEKDIISYPVKIFKNVDFEELEKLYFLSKIYWHAAGYREDTERNPERAEHFGITTVEAMAHKVVPVVINKGGQSEIVENNIDGFLWDSESDLLVNTKKLMVDTELREQMGKLGMKKAERFTIERFGVDLKKMIE